MKTPKYPYVVAKVLVIDDSKMMRLYLSRCLEKAGYEVEEWVPMSAMEAPDFIKSSAPEPSFRIPAWRFAYFTTMESTEEPLVGSRGVSATQVPFFQ